LLAEVAARHHIEKHSNEKPKRVFFKDAFIPLKGSTVGDYTYRLSRRGPSLTAGVLLQESLSGKLRFPERFSTTFNDGNLCLIC